MLLGENASFAVQMSHVRKTVNEALDNIALPKRALDESREKIRAPC